MFKKFALIDPEWYELFKDSHNDRDRRIKKSITMLDSFFGGNNSKFSNFDVPNAISIPGIQKLLFLKLSHYFQHFNLNFEDLPYIGEPPYKENQKGRDAFPAMFDFKAEHTPGKTIFSNSSFREDQK